MIFVGKYVLEDFIVVADLSLMNNSNITELEISGYKYIIGIRIKTENKDVKE